MSNVETTNKSGALTRRSALTGLAAAVAVLAAPSFLRAAPLRIVTVGGGVTETVFALGRGGDIVATDAASTFPHAAAASPKFGYPKALTASALLERRPDVILMADEVGPRAALDEAGAAGAKIVRLPEARRVGDIAAGVRLIAQAIGEPVRGDALAAALDEDLALVAEGLRGAPTRRRALVLLGAPDADMLIVAGRGSPAAFALDVAGAGNAAEGIAGWSWIKPAAAQALDPDAVVAMSAASPISLDRVLAAPVAVNTAAGRDKRVATVEAQAFTGFGPRAAHAIHSVASQIYPEVRFAAPPPRPWADVETASL